MIFNKLFFYFHSTTYSSDGLIFHWPVFGGPFSRARQINFLWPFFFSGTAFFQLDHYYRLPRRRSHVECEFNFPVTVVIINNTHTRMQFKSVGAYTIYVRHNKVKCEWVKSPVYISVTISDKRARCSDSPKNDYLFVAHTKHKT